MTFSETIDALIPIYEEGMKAQSFWEIPSYLRLGLCYASYVNFGFHMVRNRQFNNYRINTGGLFWFPITYELDEQPISEIIETCIRPRLELLKRIQKDLKKEKS